LFGYCQGVIDLNAEIPDRAFDLGMPEQELDGPQIARPPLDQGNFSAAQRMRPEQPRVQSNATNPLGDEPGILASGHTSVGAAMAGEQELARPFAGGLQIIINCPTDFDRSIQSYRTPGFLLPDGCAIRCIAAGGDVLDPDGDDVAATKLAVDC
jgi:hypothetical protein